MDINNQHITGVDIGGTHATAARVNIARHHLIPHTLQRSAINSNQPAASLVTAWAQLIRSTTAQGDDTQNGAGNNTAANNAANTSHETVIGISMPGPFNYEQGISLMHQQDKFRAIYNVNIKQLLAQELSIPAGHIHFVNDAAAFLTGEMHAGAVTGYTSVLGLTLGTGLGAALHTHGHTADAELWNSPFKQGIAEDYFATCWFTNNYSHILSSAGHTPQQGHTLGVKEIIAAATPQQLTEIFSTYAANMQQFLQPLIQQHNLQAIVFGGNISQAAGHFLPQLSAALHHTYPQLHLCVSQLGEQAALVGAAFHAANSMAAEAPAANQ